MPARNEHEWKTIRSVDRFDDMEIDLIQRCVGCGAARRVIVHATGRRKTVFIDPDPLPPSCRREEDEVEITVSLKAKAIEEANISLGLCVSCEAREPSFYQDPVWREFCEESGFTHLCHECAQQMELGPYDPDWGIDEEGA